MGKVLPFLLRTSHGVISPMRGITAVQAFPFVHRPARGCSSPHRAGSTEASVVTRSEGNGKTDPKFGEFGCRFLRVQYRYLYHPWVTTTLNINDELLLTAKAAAVQQRTTLTRLTEEGLQAHHAA